MWLAISALINEFADVLFKWYKHIYFGRGTLVAGCIQWLVFVLVCGVTEKIMDLTCKNKCPPLDVASNYPFGRIAKDVMSFCYKTFVPDCHKYFGATCL